MLTLSKTQDLAALLVRTKEAHLIKPSHESLSSVTLQVSPIVLPPTSHLPLSIVICWNLLEFVTTRKVCTERITLTTKLAWEWRWWGEGALRIK